MNLPHPVQQLQSFVFTAKQVNLDAVLIRIMPGVLSGIGAKIHQVSLSVLRNHIKGGGKIKIPTSLGIKVYLYISVLGFGQIKACFKNAV